MVYPGLRKSRKITPFLTQRTVDSNLHAEGGIWNIFLLENSHCHSMNWFFSSDIVVTRLFTGWWFDPGTCCLYFCLGSTGSDKLACNVFFIYVWEFVEPTWNKVCNIIKIELSNALKPISSPVDISLAVICRCAQKSSSGSFLLCGWQQYMAIQNMTYPLIHFSHCWNTPPTTSLC